MSLGYALRRGDWDAAASLITPVGAREKDWIGALPLHWAAANQAPVEVVAQLVAAYAEAAREKDSNGSVSYTHLTLPTKA